MLYSADLHFAIISGILFDITQKLCHQAWTNQSVMVMEMVMEMEMVMHRRHVRTTWVVISYTKILAQSCHILHSPPHAPCIPSWQSISALRKLTVLRFTDWQHTLTHPR